MYVLLTCLSCGQPVGHLRKTYLELVQKFSKEPDSKGRTPEFRALAELAEKHGFDTTSYCCRRTIECDYDATDIITGE